MKRVLAARRGVPGMQHGRGDGQGWELRVEWVGGWTPQWVREDQCAEALKSVPGAVETAARMKAAPSKESGRCVCVLVLRVGAANLVSESDFGRSNVLKRHLA